MGSIGWVEKSRGVQVGGDVGGCAVYNAAAAVAGREEGNDESYSNSIKRRAALNWN